MTNMKKFLALLLSALFIIALFSGCSQSGTGTPADGSVGAPAPTDSGGSGSSAPTNSGGPGDVTLSIAWWGGQARHDYTQELLDLYTAGNPHVTFEPIPGDWAGYWDALSVRAAGRNLPDIIQMDYLYISTYANSQAIADLQPFVNDGTINVSDIDNAMVNSGNIGGRLAGIPLSVSTLALGTNPEVLAEAGIDPISADWTWDDFINVCLQVKERTGKYGFASNFADVNWLQYWVRQHGYNLFNDEGSALGLDDASIIADFIEWQVDLVNAGAMPNPDEYMRISSLDHGARPVATGDAAFVENWSNYTNVVAATYDGATVTLPPLRAGGSEGLWQKPGMFFSIAENSSQKEEAAKFIDWFVNSTAANDIIKGERGTPVSSAVRDYLAGEDLTRAQSLMFEYVSLAVPYCGETPPPDPEGNAEVSEIMKLNLDMALYGTITPMQAAENFIREASAVLARNR
jgi:multiple sugar transport system substrate-binding protein